jgi:hypothetical protein
MPDTGAGRRCVRVLRRAAAWLGAAVALRRAEAISASREYPDGRWCDHVERAINARVIHGDPREL